MSIDFFLRPSTSYKIEPQEKYLRFYIDRVGIGIANVSAPEPAIQRFMGIFSENFQFGFGDMRFVEEQVVEQYRTKRFIQHNIGKDVYNSYITFKVDESNWSIRSVYSSYNYNIPIGFDINNQRTEDEIKDIIKEKIGHIFQYEVHSVKDYIYEEKYGFKDKLKIYPDYPRIPNRRYRQALRKIKIKKVRKGKILNIWQVMVKTNNPFSIYLEILVDDKTGNIISIQSLNHYQQHYYSVFIPDPVTQMQSDSYATKRWGRLAPTNRFNQILQPSPHPFSRLSAVNQSQMYSLTGPYCVIENIDRPRTQIPMEQSPNFVYDVEDKQFFAVMAYYWIDRAQHYIQSVLRVNNAANFQIPCDPDGGILSMMSYFQPILTNVGNENRVTSGYISLGSFGAPVAADAAIILHEYGHAVQLTVGFPYDKDNGELREGFADIFARLFLDRFNLGGHHREEIFPFANNPGGRCWNRWSRHRRVNYHRDYSCNLPYYLWGKHRLGILFATTIWNIYLSFGGASTHQNTSERAADLMLRLLLIANNNYAFYRTWDTEPFDNHRAYAAELSAADADQEFRNFQNPSNMGLYHKVVNYHFQQRNLDLSRFGMKNDTVYIDDGRNGGYEYQELNNQCTEIVITHNNNPPSSPNDHVDPAPGVTNYVWVRVKSNIIPRAIVNIYYSNANVVNLFPANFAQLQNVNQPADFTQNKTIWVGPFTYVASAAGTDEHLVAIIHAEEDPANSESIEAGSNVDLNTLISFDNNIALRIVCPR